MEEVDVKEFYSVSSSSVQSDNGMSWSEDHKISLISSSALHILGFILHQNMKSKLHILFIVLLVFMSSSSVNCSNITDRVFGPVTDLLPAAFGDFNSDELTDLFAIRDGGKTVEIFLAADQEPLLRPDGLRCKFDQVITSVVPGDFDGDSHMDVMVTVNNGDKTEVYITWGGGEHLNCSNDKPFIVMRGQPLALDYDHNMIVDLFGMNEDGKRMFWVFNDKRTPPRQEPLNEEGNFSKLRDPHSHAFFDVNDDYAPDLFLSVEKGYEIWLQTPEKKYVYNKTISAPQEVEIIGQSLFIDLELEGILQHIIPVCIDKNCDKSTLFVDCSLWNTKKNWCNLNPNLKDPLGKTWRFVKPKSGNVYLNTITLRGGDFNMDGYPDLLVTLHEGDMQKAYLLENVPCEAKESCDGLSRTFKVRWDTLSSMNKDTSMALFYDLYQDGVLDVILATQDRVQAFRNTLDYDANFVKVMVLAGRGGGRGTSLPGARISYHTTTQEGSPRTAVAAQLPQSAYFALGLPYSIFGLGRTPNFVDTLTVGVGGQSREWTQIIPNSQMIVVPHPPSSPARWRARLFVTPSKLILLSVAALTGTCCLIVAIIVGLYMKERREDRIEKLQEAHRFHFDAM